MTTSIASLKRFAVDGEIHRIIFFGGIFVATVYFLYLSLALPGAARLFPLLTLSVGVILLVIRLGTDLGAKFVPELTDRVARRILGAEQDDDDELMSISDLQQEAESVTVIRQLKMVCWVVVFTVAMYIFGIINAIPLIMFVFLLIESDIGILKSIVITAGVYGLVYALFIAILNVRMYEGIIPIF